MGKVCAFLGNDYDSMSGRTRIRRPNQQVKDCLKEQIINLIENEDVDTFLVGEKGGYEVDSYDTVLEVKDIYPQINVVLVVSSIRDLQYVGKDDSHLIHQRRYCDTWFLPDKAAVGYKRWCIVHRNNYIAENTDFIIGFNQYQGRAYQFIKKAKNKGVQIIELTELYDF